MTRVALMPDGLRLFHGGVPGLLPGDRIAGGNTRPTVDGCAFCVARAAGGAVLGPHGEAVDGPSARPDRVYLTTDRDYARFYASMFGRGDLYRVDPVGGLDMSTEDHFPTWTAKAAVVLAAVERAVLLTPSQRRRLTRRWVVADATYAAGESP